jgi:hypothetical protein
MSLPFRHPGGDTGWLALAAILFFGVSLLTTSPVPLRLGALCLLGWALVHFVRR